MAGTAVITSPTTDRYQAGGLREILFTWTAHTDGAVLISENTGATAQSGYVASMQTIPDAVAVPTTYTATLKLANGCVLKEATLRSTATAEIVDVGWHVLADLLKVTISGAGSGAQGVVRVLLRTA